MSVGTGRDAEPAEAVSSTAPAAASPSGHRKDIQGLRALAILAVVAYHAHVPGISGGFVGVDFFFVLSGFLITGLLVSEQARHGFISLPGFWARRARRLLPASSLVLVVTAIATMIWIPAIDRRDVGTDIGWSALFGANWRFALQETDYLAQDRSPSPVLHYWSLGVEEQFYFIWPLLVAGLAFLVARGLLRRQRLTAAYVVIFSVISVVSLLWCIYETNQSQPFAFFGTPARAWQLSLGALLAVILPKVRLTRLTRVLLGVVGLTGYAVALLWLSEAGTNGILYPGVLALLPSLAAGALIAAGAGGDRTPLDRVLSIAPLQTIGDLSYSWYLWHWPAFVLLPLVVGTNTWPVRAVGVLLSFTLAWLSFRYVENPIRTSGGLRRRPGRSLALGAALIAVVFVPVVVLHGTTANSSVQTVDGSTGTLRPDPLKAREDVFSMRDLGCDLDYEETEIVEEGCVFGDLKGGRDVVLSGDSHAVAVYPGLGKAAEREGWRVHSWTKSACPTADVTKYENSRHRAFHECDTYRKALVDKVKTTDPDLVVLGMSYNPKTRVVDRETGDVLPGKETREQMVEGLRRTVQTYSDAGIPVVVIADLPPASFDPPSCLVEKGAVKPCLVPNPQGETFEHEVAEGLDGVSLFNLRKGVCNEDTCTPVKGDIVTYRDTNHITKTYSLTLADRFAKVLKQHR